MLLPAKLIGIPGRLHKQTRQLLAAMQTAKALLEEKGVSFSEIRIEGNPDRTAEAKQRSGGRETVPQIFIDNEYVGGYHELSTMELEGKLDRMLGLS